MFNIIRHPVFFPPVLLYRHRFINNIPNLQFIISRYVNKAEVKLNQTHTHHLINLLIRNNMDLSLH